MPCHSSLLRRLLRVIPLVLTLACLAPRARAATVTFDTNTPAANRLIDTTTMTYEGYDVIVSGITLTINGTHSFASLTVQNGATVTHAPGLVGGMNLTVSGNVTIAVSSYMSVSGQGYGGITGKRRGRRRNL